MPEITNAHFAAAHPELSVLIPFLRDNPAPLLDRLFSERHLRQNVEIIVLDDGTNSQSLTRELEDRINASDIPAKLISLEKNVGRALGRNKLADSARGQFLLFLDADMLPDSSDFLETWLSFARSHAPDAAFGGLSLKQAPNDKRFAVHRSMASKSDCVPAQLRQLQPEKHLFTSNLLIRNDIYKAYPFDKGFSGWGWEDVEWGMRVSNAHHIHHPDIPATHTGLDTVADLKRKYVQSADNFARLAHLHPGFVAQYPSYKVARMIGRLHMGSVVETVADFISGLERLPVPLRALSLRFYRAALYAKALRS